MAELQKSPNWDLRCLTRKRDMSGFPYNEGFPGGAYVGKYYTLVDVNGELLYNCRVDDSRQYASEGKEWKVPRQGNTQESAVLCWKEQEKYYVGELQ